MLGIMRPPWPRPARTLRSWVVAIWASAPSLEISPTIVSTVKYQYMTKLTTVIKFINFVVIKSEFLRLDLVFGVEITHQPTNKLLHMAPCPRQAWCLCSFFKCITHVTCGMCKFGGETKKYYFQLHHFCSQLPFVVRTQALSGRLGWFISERGLVVES